MAFTVETGTGVSGANSYGAVEGADAYFLDRGVTTWASQNSTTKQQALIKATDYIETRWRAHFKGTRSSTTQGLSWPRDDAYDVDNNAIVGLPTDLARACYEYALRAVSAALMPDPTTDTSGRLVASKREKVGPIEEETHFEAGGAMSTTLKPYPAADLLILGLLRTSGSHSGRAIRA